MKVAIYLPILGFLAIANEAVCAAPMDTGDQIIPAQLCTPTKHSNVFWTRPELNNFDDQDLYIFAEIAMAKIKFEQTVSVSHH